MAKQLEKKTIKALRPVDAAILVARVVELQSVRLAHMEATGPEDAMLFAREAQGWQVSKPSAQYAFDEPSMTLRTFVSVSIRALDSSPGASTVESGELAIVRADFELTYTLKSTAPPKELREGLFGGFANINSLHNAWPYFREFFQSATVRMGLPPVTLPTFRVPRESQTLAKKPTTKARGRKATTHPAARARRT